MQIKNLILYLSVLAFIIGSCSLRAQQEWQANKFVDIKDFEDRSWDMTGFSLEKEVALKIRARGAASKAGWVGKAWILNSENRIVVWEMDYDNTSRGMGRNERVFDDIVTFPAGNYEVYYGTSSFKNIDIDNFGELMDGIFSGFKKGRTSRKWGVSIEPKNAKDLSTIHPFKPREEEQAIVRITRVRDDANIKEGFSITEPLEIRIYAIGEGESRGQEMYDYGWIMNDDTREVIWEMQSKKTRHAGGAKKNQLFDDKITLPPGNYLVHYITDDSHSYEDFNMMPPYDILHYGITIWAAPGSKYQGVVKEYQGKENRDTKIIDLTRAQDDRAYKEGFELLEPLKMRIYAIGEYSHSKHEMCDYGWIQDARTQKIVWQMTPANTKHAGGGDKNRMVDTIIELPEGAYQVNYVTDTGHSYRNWNASPPFDPDYYGITIWAVDSEKAKSSVRLYSERDDPRILLSITAVGDDELLQKKFQLKNDTLIRIYAIGEGDRHEMFDYGWIEDENGHKVWEMEFDETQHAGGAQKNRLFNDTIELDAGSYRAYFKTDDCHSFEDWNSSPPDDPGHWGITIIEEKD